MNFVFDHTAEGRVIKCLTIVDDATYESVAIEVRCAITKALGLEMRGTDSSRVPDTRVGAGLARDALPQSDEGHRAQGALLQIPILPRIFLTHSANDSRFHRPSTTPTLMTPRQGATAMNGKDAGFTLIELLVALAILAIALSLGAPAFSSLAQHARESNTYHLLTTSLAAARLTAVKNGAPVTACPSSDGITCRNDEVWETGWLIYADPRRADQPADGKAVLQSIDRSSGHLTLRSTLGRKRIRFSPEGWSYGSNLSIRLCDSEGRFLGQVVVNNAGRARTERYTVPRPCPFRP